MLLVVKKHRSMLRHETLRLRKRIALARAKVPTSFTEKQARDIGSLTIAYGPNLRRTLRLTHKHPRELVKLQALLASAIKERREFIR